MIWALNDQHRAQAPHAPPHAQWYRSPLPPRQQTRPAILSMYSAPCPCSSCQPAMAVVEDAILNIVKLCAMCYYFSWHSDISKPALPRWPGRFRATICKWWCEATLQLLQHRLSPESFKIDLLTHLQCCSTNVLSLPAWERLHAAQTFHPFTSRFKFQQPPPRIHPARFDIPSCPNRARDTGMGGASNLSHMYEILSQFFGIAGAALAATDTKSFPAESIAASQHAFALKTAAGLA